MEHVVVVLGDQDPRVDLSEAYESERRSLCQTEITRRGKLERTAATGFPWDVNVNATLRAASGALGQRTQTFSDARLNQGTVTLRMEPYGAQQGPVVPVTSLRVAKKFRVAERYAVDVNFSVFNLINSSAAVSTSYLSGTFGRITDILPPRVARFGAEFSF